MKTRTIQKVLRGKIDDWLDNVENHKVRQAIKQDAIVTGGSIASMLLGETVNDFDVYFAKRETVVLVASYYLAEWWKLNGDIGYKISLREDNPDRVKIQVESVGIAEEKAESGDQDPDSDQAPGSQDTEPGSDKPRYRPVFLSSNAITLSDRIQLVIRFYGEPAAIHKNFDFVHCLNYYQYAENKLVLNPTALECLLTRELRYQGSLYPVSSVLRLRKFLTRGWTCNAGQQLKMLLQVSGLNLMDPDVLEEQLVGVDAHYFKMFLVAIQHKQEGLTTEYLSEVLDRIFG